MQTLKPPCTICRRSQRTIGKPVTFSGIGIHSGVTVDLGFYPAEEGTGIVFQRVDLPSKPIIPATVEYVVDTNRSTTIGLAGVQIHTVEHVLAAIHAYQIDNVRIEISSVEPPVGNGSSDIFVEMLEEAGVVEQKATVPTVKIRSPLIWEKDDMYLIALPHEGFRVSYSLHYPESKVLQNQFHSAEITPENFKKEIAPCRTFSRYEEVEYLIDRGLIKGGSLSNTVIVKGEAVFSKGGLFFPNEMARHKLLDIVGDLTLVGFYLSAHIIGYRTGHAANVEFAKKILQYITSEGVERGT